MQITKYYFVLTLSLIGGLILTGCGTQSAPGSAETQATQSSGSVAAEVVAPTDVSQGTAPTDTPAEAATASVSFSNDILPILESRCFNCHGGERVENGLRLGRYEDVLAGSENGAVIVPGDAANSLLVELVANQKMPKRGPKLTPPQVQLITDWVNSGAPNN